MAVYVSRNNLSKDPDMRSTTGDLTPFLFSVGTGRRYLPAASSNKDTRSVLDSSKLVQILTAASPICRLTLKRGGNVNTGICGMMTNRLCSGIVSRDWASQRVGKSYYYFYSCRTFSTRLRNTWCTDWFLSFIFFAKSSGHIYEKYKGGVALTVAGLKDKLPEKMAGVSRATKKWCSWLRKKSAAV